MSADASRRRAVFMIDKSSLTDNKVFSRKRAACRGARCASL
jgi:hypothetical protein